ncbi:DUF1450 domain-containing protein [Anaeromicropila herbilytica]|nr:DUF1450 domain-containing protein [Anaeromicropila herbilytica]
MNRLKKDFNDIDISAESCLGYCGDCAVGPYALVNNEMIQADTAEELYEKIKKLI